MWLLIVAIVLLGLKFAAVGPFATLSWWWIAGALGLVFIYWELIDPWLDISKRRAVREMDARRAERVERERARLGLGGRRKK